MLPQISVDASEKLMHIIGMVKNKYLELARDWQKSCLRERTKIMLKVDKKLLGAMLRKYRLAAGMTQAEVAAKIGIIPQFVTNCENGYRQMSLENLAKFIELMETTKPKPKCKCKIPEYKCDGIAGL